MIYAAFDEADVLWGLGDTPEEAISDAKIEDSRNTPSGIEGALTVFHTADMDDADAAKFYGGGGRYVLDDEAKTFTVACQ